jgi:hypothetical protein
MLSNIYAFVCESYVSVVCGFNKYLIKTNYF